MVGVECGRTDTPGLSPLTRHVLVDLGFERVCIVYPGDRRLSLAGSVEALPLAALAGGIPGLPG
jgi:hypothetical protein